MRTWQRVLLVPVVVSAVAGTVGAVSIHRMTTGKLDHGRVFTATSGPLTVKAGELFSIEVSAYRTAGDIWTVADPAPDSAVVRTVGDEYVRTIGLKDLPGLSALDGAGALGSGGHYYFVFRAAGNPGRTTVTLHVDYRDHEGWTFSGEPERTRRQFTVQVD
ncbi:protease inhibitor I42 family protein [Kitasatospora sp. NPDC059599]|uniref:protease inhibitor I42 family protein n=1 Tax=Kitasatospora sp. NPDC059599 TaxID=3346880 RepID=UPI0036C96E10